MVGLTFPTANRSGQPTCSDDEQNNDALLESIPFADINFKKLYMNPTVT